MRGSQPIVAVSLSESFHLPLLRVCVLAEAKRDSTLGYALEGLQPLHISLWYLSLAAFLTALGLIITGVEEGVFVFMPQRC